MSRILTTNSDYQDLTRPNQILASANTLRPRSIFSKAAAAILSHVKAVVRRRTLRRLEQDLARIDDRMLKDIGLDRSEIRRAVRYGRYF